MCTPRQVSWQQTAIRRRRASTTRTFKKHYDVRPGRIEIEEFLKKSTIGQTFPIESRYYVRRFRRMNAG
jgi:hypothetical protein